MSYPLAYATIYVSHTKYRQLNGLNYNLSHDLPPSLPFNTTDNPQILYTNYTPSEQDLELTGSSSQQHDNEVLIVGVLDAPLHTKLHTSLHTQNHTISSPPPPPSQVVASADTVCPGGASSALLGISPSPGNLINASVVGRTLVSTCVKPPYKDDAVLDGMTTVYEVKEEHGEKGVEVRGLLPYKQICCGRGGMRRGHGFMTEFFAAMVSVNKHVQDPCVKAVWLKRKLPNVCTTRKSDIAEQVQGSNVGRVVVLDCLKVQGVQRNISRKCCKVREGIEEYFNLTPGEDQGTVFYVRNGQCLMTERDVSGIGEDGDRGVDKDDEKMGYTTRIGGERWEDGKELVEWFKRRVEERGAEVGRSIIVMEIGVETERKVGFEDEIGMGEVVVSEYDFVVHGDFTGGVEELIERATMEDWWLPDCCRGYYKKDGKFNAAVGKWIRDVGVMMGKGIKGGEEGGEIVSDREKARRKLLKDGGMSRDSRDGASSNRSILFVGPPGSMKSTIMHHVATLLGGICKLRITKVMTTDTANTYNGQSEAKIRGKFSSLAKTGGILECEDMEIKFVAGGEGEFFSWFGVFDKIVVMADTDSPGGGKWGGKFGRILNVGEEDVEAGIKEFLGKVKGWEGTIPEFVDTTGWTVWRGIKFCELVKDRMKGGGDGVLCDDDFRGALKDLQLYDDITL